MAKKRSVLPDGRQVCFGCEVPKPLSEFSSGRARCKCCTAKKRMVWHNANREKSIAISKSWKDRNQEQQTIYGAAHRKKNKIVRNAQARAWRAANKARVQEYNREYTAANYADALARSNLRHAMKRNAVPGWANMDRIKEIYAHAVRVTRDLGQKFHVDHIVPLQSPLVCGLHVEANLQILDYQSNLRKGNRVWPDMPTEQMVG